VGGSWYAAAVVVVVVMTLSINRWNDVGEDGSGSGSGSDVTTRTGEARD
jgi:hypothetical protein